MTRIDNDVLDQQHWIATSWQVGHDGNVDSADQMLSGLRDKHLPSWRGANGVPDGAIVDVCGPLELWVQLCVQINERGQVLSDGRSNA